jgi:hypothetical protein
VKGRPWPNGVESARGGREDDAARGAQNPDRFGQHLGGGVGLFQRMDQQNAIEGPRRERQGALVDQDRAVAPHRGPGLGPLPARHGRDLPTSADEGVEPRHGVAEAQDVAAGGLAPGVVQTPRDQAADDLSGRLTVEGPQFLDATPHACRIGRADARR